MSGRLYFCKAFLLCWQKKTCFVLISLIGNKMNINSVNSVRNINFERDKSVSSNVVNNNGVTASKMQYATLPASVYKANFIPSFGKYRKVKDIFLQNKDTEMNTRAALMKETIGDSVSFKVVVNREDAGYLDMKCDAIFPEDEFLCSEPDNNIPEVRHIRSLLGDRYSGIGTELMNAAVNESVVRGKGGSLWLKAEQGYARTLSKYRQDENPIPFYYKLGFRSLDEDLDAYIKRCISKSSYGMLPETAVLILSSADYPKFKNYYANHFKFSDKIA